MLNKSTIISFVATKAPQKAREFYEQILGLTFISEDDFAIVFDANKTMLRVQKVQEHTPVNHTVLGWDVDDIYKEVKELLERGVKCEQYEWIKQDELGIWTAPSMAKIAWFKDPDENTLSFTQFP